MEDNCVLAWHWNFSIRHLPGDSIIKARFSADLNTFCSSPLKYWIRSEIIFFCSCVILRELYARAFDARFHLGVDSSPWTLKILLYNRLAGWPLVPAVLLAGSVEKRARWARDPKHKLFLKYKLWSSSAIPTPPKLHSAPSRPVHEEGECPSYREVWMEWGVDCADGGTGTHSCMLQLINWNSLVSWGLGMDEYNCLNETLVFKVTLKTLVSPSFCLLWALVLFNGNQFWLVTISLESVENFN